MINVQEAKKYLLQHLITIEKEEVVLQHADGKIVTENIYAPVSHPLFSQTAVDGYAVRYQDIKKNKPLIVIGELKAGDFPSIQLTKDTAVNLFTGAAIPDGADLVVMQEDTKKRGNEVYILKKELKKGENIRKKGEQIKKGQLALLKGSKINAAGIGFLASLGISSIKVSCMPRVEIVVTGNEFYASVHPDNISLTQNDTLSITQEKGKIFESNGVMLQSMLKNIGINSSYKKGIDDVDTLKDIIYNQSKHNDIIIITGGVSVGKYDFTKTVLEQLGYKIIFHKIAQKPGKPFLFAKKENKVVFGLPGNPRAVWICFHQYIASYIHSVMGSHSIHTPILFSPLTHDLNIKTGRTQFLTACFHKDGVKIQKGQDSHLLKSLINTDIIVELSGKKSFYKQGTKVKGFLIRK